jgi:geranyl-CoA carboxylase alpha subunit
MGIRVISVYSEADAGLPFVAESDEAVQIGPPPAAQSYLNADAILAAAARTGAQAVHPGYGFLAENASFAQRVIAAGLVWIGPSPDAIEQMGDKIRARNLMASAGIPVAAGSAEPVTDAEAAIEQAERIGYPVMIKAAAGGGGIGMTVAPDAGRLRAGFETARSRAERFFGNPSILIERYIGRARHVEVQILGLADGRVIALGERDCSVQRRHQKLIEEAPSPAVSPKLRERMGDVAVAAVRSLRYEGAGTLEFLLDENGEFHFMEMNTRLQVEHPVTEAITGRDLVELQLRVARGEPLGLVQEDITFAGHAIEVRLCSEDAGHDFMPQSGNMALWQMPEGVRVEHALQSRSEIPPFYDSMIAKIISHGRDRNEARCKLICALEQTVALGVTTNQAFLMSCLRHPSFAAGEATTAFIAKHRDELLAHKDAATETALVALLLYVTNSHAPPWQSGRSLAATFPVPLRLAIGDVIFEVEIVRERDGVYIAEFDGHKHRFEIDELGRDSIRFRAGGVMESAKFFRNSDKLFLLHRGMPIAIRDLTLAAPKAAASNGGDGKVRAAMNGRVVAVLVKPDERVAAGQPVMTLEAMKMEHVHVAAIAGVVAAIDVVEGEQVTTGKIVVEIEAG